MIRMPQQIRSQKGIMVEHEYAHGGRWMQCAPVVAICILGVCQSLVWLSLVHHEGCRGHNLVATCILG